MDYSLFEKKIKKKHIQNFYFWSTIFIAVFILGFIVYLTYFKELFFEIVLIKSILLMFIVSFPIYFLTLVLYYFANKTVIDMYKDFNKKEKNLINRVNKEKNEMIYLKELKDIYKELSETDYLSENQSSEVKEEYQKVNRDYLKQKAKYIELKKNSREINNKDGSIKLDEDNLWKDVIFQGSIYYIFYFILNFVPLKETFLDFALEFIFYNITFMLAIIYTSYLVKWYNYISKNKLYSNIKKIMYYMLEIFIGVIPLGLFIYFHKIIKNNILQKITELIFQ